MLKANPDVEIRNRTGIYAMRVREATDPAERESLWKISVAAYSPYQEYQDRTDRIIPLLAPNPGYGRWRQFYRGGGYLGRDQTRRASIALQH